VQPISFGPQQFRVSEALTILPAFTPAAIPGLFAGCLVANTMSPMGVPDLVFGSLATLAAAWLTRLAALRLDPARRPVARAALVPLPPVAVNALVIGAMLAWFYEMPFPVAAADVGLGQLGACYCIGVPLYLLLCSLEKRKALGLG